MRVLVAEDEVVSRQALETMLTKWGYDVIAASDGVEAWQILQREDAPRLAIVNWLMPRMDGTEVCGKVRALAVAVTPSQTTATTASLTHSRTPTIIWPPFPGGPSQCERQV